MAATNTIEKLDDQHLEKQVLALDALSELTRQFAAKPDFQELLISILYTYSGQFGVGSCFITVRNPHSKSEKPVFAGISKFKDFKTFELFGAPEIDANYLLKKTKAYRVEDLRDEIKSDFTARILEIGNLKVLVPLIHGDKLVGLIGVGDKLKVSPYSDSELELMSSIASAITPLLVNSFLFKEIAALSNWYHEIINNVKQGVFVFDENRKLTGINQAGTDIMIRITDGEFNKSTISNQRLESVFSEKYFQGWHNRILDLLSNGEGQSIENAIAGRSELKQIFNIRATVVKKNRSGKGDLIVTLDEITEQKQNEERMFDLERLADKGLMAASISHELNNFLGIILAGVELTHAAVERNQNDNAVASLEKVKSNVSKMIRYTAGLMDYSRLDTNKESADINEIIEDVLSFLVVQRRFKGCKIKSQLTGGISKLELDTDQISQLLLNLLNNAADAIAEDKQKSGIIEISTSGDDKSILLTITDNGNGMKPEVKENLFKKQLTTKKTGHGFGLVTCGKIINNHSGTVEIKSQVGSGTTFDIRFPKQ